MESENTKITPKATYNSVSHPGTGDASKGEGTLSSDVTRCSKQYFVSLFKGLLERTKGEDPSKSHGDITPPQVPSSRTGGHKSSKQVLLNTV